MYERLKLKFRLIRHFNPKASLFVCSVLPTKSREINNRVEHFNEHIFNNLIYSDLHVMRVHGFHRLLGDNGLLSQRMSKYTDRHGNTDLIHINDIGTRLVAGLIKTAIFLRLQKGVSRKKGPTNRVDGRPFNSVAREPQSPQRIGRDGYQVR